MIATACVHRVHLNWVDQAPPELSQTAWGTVGLAAVAAQEHGRQRLYACRDVSDRAAEVAVVRRIGVEVIADFRSQLAAFTSLRRPPCR